MNQLDKWRSGCRDLVLNEKHRVGADSILITEKKNKE